MRIRTACSWWNSPIEAYIENEGEQTAAGETSLNNTQGGSPCMDIHPDTLKVQVGKQKWWWSMWDFSSNCSHFLRETGLHELRVRSGKRWRRSRGDRRLEGKWTGQYEVIANHPRIHCWILVWHLKIRSVSKIVGFPFPSLVHLGVGVGAEQVGLDSLERVYRVYARWLYWWLWILSQIRREVRK